MVKVTVTTDIGTIGEALSGRIESTTRLLERAVLASCEPYVPYYTGNLCSSGHVSGVGNRGEVTYSADYASECYYASRSFNRKKHPKATARWFEAAKTADLDKWVSAAKSSFNGYGDGGASDEILMSGGYRAAAY